VSTGADAPRRGVQADSLPLTLPSPPPLPGRLRPEASVPCSEPFDNPDWRFSVDWDGSRALMVVSGGRTVRLQGETGIDLAGRFPELIASGEIFDGDDVVLDGVVAVLDAQGRPDLAAFGRRLAVGADGAAVTPAVFLATDVLHSGGASTTSWPLDRRLETLSAAAGSSEMVQVPDHVSGRGTALAEAAAERGLAALLARRGDAPYRPGVASPERLRVALSPQATCVVLGIEARANGPGRLLLGEFVAGRLVYTGRVTGPHDQVVDRWLNQRADAAASAVPCLAVPLADSRTRWLRPSLTATVAYAARGPDGSIRQATLLALRDDVDPAWCVRREPVQPPRSASARSAFNPTILVPLPFSDGALVARPPH
jgi:bifunctional non-homologous end joining protein LigD